MLLIPSTLLNGEFVARVRGCKVSMSTLERALVRPWTDKCRSSASHGCTYMAAATVIDVPPYRTLRGVQSRVCGTMALSSKLLFSTVHNYLE